VTLGRLAASVRRRTFISLTRGPECGREDSRRRRSEGRGDGGGACRDQGARQDLKALDLKKNDLAAMEVAYFADRSVLNVPAGGLAPVEEFLASAVDVKGHRVEADVWHFSGYMVAWGRKR
jgi:hypothetical protein